MSKASSKVVGISKDTGPSPNLDNISTGSGSILAKPHFVNKGLSVVIVINLIKLCINCKIAENTKSRAFEFLEHTVCLHVYVG